MTATRKPTLPIAILQTPPGGHGRDGEYREAGDTAGTEEPSGRRGAPGGGGNCGDGEYREAGDTAGDGGAGGRRGAPGGAGHDGDGGVDGMRPEEPAEDEGVGQRGMA